MTKTAQEQIKELRAATDARIEALKKQAISELQLQLKAAELEVMRLKNDLLELGGKPMTNMELLLKGKHIEPSSTRKRLPKLEKGSDEWNKIAEQIKIVLKRYPEGLNGKEIATKLGKTEPKEIKRVQLVVQGTCRREGAGIQTRFFVQ